MLEFHINHCIWELAGVPPATGACLTAQMVSLHSRLSALLALLKLRRASNATVAAVNSFADDSRGPNEMRNRIVHDVWMKGSDLSVVRLEITAPKKLKFGLRPVTSDELDKNYSTIRKFVLRSASLRNGILDELPSLPEIPESELHPITMTLLAQ